jgi:hypothetical protein
VVGRHPDVGRDPEDLLEPLPLVEAVGESQPVRAIPASASLQRTRSTSVTRSSDIDPTLPGGHGVRATASMPQAT